MEGEDRFLELCLRWVSWSSAMCVLMIGFDMSTMGTSYFDEGQIDINEAKEVFTNEFIIKVCAPHISLRNAVWLTYNRTWTLRRQRSRA